MTSYFNKIILWKENATLTLKGNIPLNLRNNISIT